MKKYPRIVSFKEGISVVVPNRANFNIKSSRSLSPTLIPSQWSIYNKPSTAASAPAPAPSMGKAVAAAPESETAPLAALLTELAVEPAALVAAETPLLILLEALLTAPLPLLLVCEALLDPDEVAPAGKTVVRVKVSVSSWSLGSSSKSVEVVV